MFGPWMQIKIKPSSGSSVNALDDVLTSTLPAAVEQQRDRGVFIYQADSDGNYTVRVLDPSAVIIILVKRRIEEHGFSVVSEERHGD